MRGASTDKGDTVWCGGPCALPPWLIGCGPVWTTQMKSLGSRPSSLSPSLFYEDLGWLSQVPIPLILCGFIHIREIFAVDTSRPFAHGLGGWSSFMAYCLKCPLTRKLYLVCGVAHGLGCSGEQIYLMCLVAMTLSLCSLTRHAICTCCFGALIWFAMF